ncbi:MAG: HemK2/MTQ2 family protein methyltransferase [Candidatus Aenigmatarchaeota archaeon]
METYEPAEDSRMLLEAAIDWLEKNAKHNMHILDMGTGSGFVINGVKEFLYRQHIDAHLLAADIDEVDAPNGVEFVQSDLFGSIKGRFDLVLFNPPYLPAGEDDRYLTETERKQLIGGQKGNEVTLRFIEQLPEHLSENGACLLLVSSKSKPGITGNGVKKANLRWKTMKSESFTFEELSVFLITWPK